MASKPATPRPGPTPYPDPQGDGCPECAVARGDLLPDGGLLLDDGELLVHAVIGGAPLAGWVVVAPRRHVESLEELDPAVRQRLFEVAARVAAVQRSTLGAAKVYLALFAEMVPHLHLHLVPRYADTPAELRGPRCFLAPPQLRLRAAELAEAVSRLRHGLSLLEAGLAE